MPNRFTGRFLRLFEPTRAYFERQFATDGALYDASPQSVFIVVVHHAENLQVYWPEVHWLFPEEVRLLSAVALAVPEGRGTLGFSPHEKRDRVKPLIASLTDHRTQQALRDMAASRARECFGSGVRFDMREADASSPDFQELVFRGVDLSNKLLVRGLSTLLKSQHLLGVSHLFLEDAVINIQISREAALELIRDHLRPGLANPSFDDAHQYLREHFKWGEALAGFFAYQHELWLTAKHPKSRMGVYWTPPLTADDFFETYEALVSVYRHLLTGERGQISASE